MRRFPRTPRAIGRLSALAALLFVASGCSTYRIKPEYRPTAYPVSVVEYDDQGRIWDKNAEAAVLSQVREAAQRGGGVVVTFIHGWHHNANPDDTNLRDFSVALSHLHDELQLPVYRNARKALHLPEDPALIGVFVGWRGRSLPGKLDYLTFWDRKAAAERVGRGDVIDLLTNIDDICTAANEKGRYTGLVTIGHSFGAQVATSAISGIMRQRVTLARDEGNTFEQRIHGFGDLVVLVNPAVEAATFSAISEATHNAAFSSSQTPVVLVVSSENDGATGSWFPFGRRLAVRHRVYRDDEYENDIRALGWYRPQLTHCMALEGSTCAGVPPRQVVHRGPVVPAEKARRGLPAADYAGVWTNRDLADPRNIQLGGDLGIAGVNLFRISGDIDPNEPFVFAKATPQVVNGHNGVFDTPFIEFLIRYAAGTELKAILVRELEKPH